VLNPNPNPNNAITGTNWVSASYSIVIALRLLIFMCPEKVLQFSA